MPVKIKLGMPALDIQAKMEIAGSDLQKSQAAALLLEEEIQQLSSRKSQLQTDISMHDSLAQVQLMQLEMLSKELSKLQIRRKSGEKDIEEVGLAFKAANERVCQKRDQMDSQKKIISRLVEKMEGSRRVRGKREKELQRMEDEVQVFLGQQREWVKKVEERQGQIKEIDVQVSKLTRAKVERCRSQQSHRRLIAH